MGSIEKNNVRKPSCKEVSEFPNKLIITQICKNKRPKLQTQPQNTTPDTVSRALRCMCTPDANLRPEFNFKVVFEDFLKTKLRSFRSLRLQGNPSKKWDSGDAIVHPRTTTSVAADLAVHFGTDSSDLV